MCSAMTTYEDLVAATLPHGLAPLVVPQLKTITLGGAVTGLGIESASFRNGCPHESVIEMDILTGDGQVVTARPDNEHRDLFYGFPNSYGTLGYALRLRIELEPVTPYIHLRHVRFGSVEECAKAIAKVCAERKWDGEQVDFIDGTWFSATECYLTLATFAATAPRASDYTGQQIYYRSIQQRSEDWLTTHDYFWRWDTDWFWCSRAFGAQNPRIRRVWPKAVAALGRLLEAHRDWNASTASSGASTPATASRPKKRSSRTSRSRSIGWRSSSSSSTTAPASNRSGCAR